MRGGRVSFASSGCPSGARRSRDDGEWISATWPPWAPGRETLTAKPARRSESMRRLARGAKFARAIDSDDDALMLQGAEIAGNLLLDGAFESFGCVWLPNAKIDGGFSCEGATLLNRSEDTSGQALNADGARIDTVLMRKVKTEGEVRFCGARIARDFDVSEGASLRNEMGAALMLSNAEIGGQVFADGVKIAGMLWLQNASIARNLDMRGAEIAHRTSLSGNAFGRAVDATSMSVGGGAMLQGANIKGELFLADARIDGYLAFGGGRYINPGHWAIRAPNARIGRKRHLQPARKRLPPHGQKNVIEGGCRWIAPASAGVGLVCVGTARAGRAAQRARLFSFADRRDRRRDRSAALNDAAGRIYGTPEAPICAALDDDVKSGWGGGSGAPRSRRLPLWAHR